MKKMLSCVILGIVMGLVGNCDAFADDVITNFTPLKYVVSPDFDEKAALYRVRMTPFLTYVTIEVVPTMDKARQPYWTSSETCVQSGNIKLPLLGADGKDNTYHSCSYDDGWGWNDVKRGDKLYYTLIFSGRLPGGMTDFSLVDNATNGRGYSFYHYQINNPDTVTVMDEEFCKYCASHDRFGFCGVYEEVGGGNMRIGCVCIDGTYALVYLDCLKKYSWWFEGDIIAVLETCETSGMFNAVRIALNKTRDDNALVVFEGNVCKMISPNSREKDRKFVKMSSYNVNATSNEQIGKVNRRDGKNKLFSQVDVKKLPKKTTEDIVTEKPRTSNTVITDIRCKRNHSNSLSIDKIELSPVQTLIHFKCTNKLAGGWMNINQKSYIVAKGKKYESTLKSRVVCFQLLLC